MSSTTVLIDRGTAAVARIIIRRPLAALGVMLALGVAAAYLTTRLTIESNQLDLISQELPEVKAVKRVVDMVGGAGHLMLGMRSSDEKLLKKTADDLNALLLSDKENVRFITYKLPVDFIQENMVLFIRTEDLIEGKRRINAYLRDQLRRANPFFIEIRKTEPVKLDLSDLVARYASIGKKSIRDDYNISDDKQMLLMLIKPMWGSTELQRTKAFTEKLTNEVFPRYAREHGLTMQEDYTRKVGDSKTIYFGFTGSYKMAVDDSYAIEESLGPVTLIAFGLIALVAIVFFRRWAPSALVITGMVLGTVLTMGFTYVTVGQLNMVTSILGGLLMGFGVDYGIHFVYRSRIELGMGRPWDEALQAAFVNAGRPALVAAVVTAGSFFVLLVSEFRGFSQFGFLAGCGTLIIALTMFAWCAALLALAGSVNPSWPARLIGTMAPPSDLLAAGEIRIPRPGLVLGVALAVVAVLSFIAIPWTDEPLPKDASLAQRIARGVRFNFNTRALIAEDQPSVLMLDEITDRFKISADPIALVTRTLDEAKEVYEELTKNAAKYPSIEQVVSVFTFVPPKETAEANAKILAEWKEELKDIDVASLPPETQEKAELFQRILDAKPFDVSGVPDVYREIFTNLPSARPENHGYLTFIYPGIDLWNGRQMLQFADEVSSITTASGKTYAAAGLPILYAKLARIVLWDGKVTVFLAAVWIFLMHFLDFRSLKLAVASVLPLVLGLVNMLGIMVLIDEMLNFMNIIMLPILLGFGVSHGLYLLHRFLEGTSPLVALRSVGSAVASSTLTTVAGFAALLAASHSGLKSMGLITCIGLLTTLVVSFTVLAAVMELLYEGRVRVEDAVGPTPHEPRPGGGGGAEGAAS